MSRRKRDGGGAWAAMASMVFMAVFLPIGTSSVQHFAKVEITAAPSPPLFAMLSNSRGAASARNDCPDTCSPP